MTYMISCEFSPAWETRLWASVVARAPELALQTDATAGVLTPLGEF